MKLATYGPLRPILRLLGIALLAAVPALAQSPAAQAPSSNSPDLDAKIQLLTESLEQTRTELSESRAEIRQLKDMLQQLLPQKAAEPAQSATGPAANSLQVKGAAEVSTPASPQKPAQIGQDDWQIVNAKLDELQQDKVETRLKYRLKLSGIVLLQAFGETGAVDNFDGPAIAFPHGADTTASFGASFRQSAIGLTGIGPDVLGARTSGDVQLDFFGGLPGGYGAATSGIVRLRLARIRLDWENTSVVGGLDVPFFSPNTPTSYLSLAVPAFAAAGNLWTWAATIRVEHRFDTAAAQLKVETGILDPSGFTPALGALRSPSSGESSHQPVYALRLSANGRDEKRPRSFGVSGIYFPEHFAAGLNASGWGVVTDWKLSPLPHTELSGEFFAGRGLDEFGGVPYIVTPSPDPDFTPELAAFLDKVALRGGWTQLKFRVDARNEFNVGVGTGARTASGLRQAAASDPFLASSLWPRNDLMFVNYIFRPRTDLLFSAEYRRLRTFQVSGPPAVASQAGMAAGFLF